MSIIDEIWVKLKVKNVHEKNRFVYIFAFEAFSFHITKDLYSRKDMNLARFNIDFM
jgi:hypothetical protein